MAFSESDWKTFKRVRAAALERYSQRIPDECSAITADESESAHDRYGRIYGLIQDRNREMARMFDDFRRSTAGLCLKLMHAHDLLREEEVAEFSAEVQASLEEVAHW